MITLDFYVTILREYFASLSIVTSFLSHFFSFLFAHMNIRALLHRPS